MTNATTSSIAHDLKKLTAIETLWHAADAVKMTHLDDPGEYSDGERVNALFKLFDALPAASLEMRSATEASSEDGIR